MFKRKIITLSAIMIAGLMTFQANVSADAVEEKPYLSLGADLSTDQKSKVLELLDVDEKALDQYNIVTVTNADEHKYLDDYLDSSVIGTKALSSVLVEKRDKGEGIDVTTKNITYCTAGMYENALTTAGVTDATVTVAGPFNITGTAALVGAMNAYEDMTGEDISSESKDAATNELVVTSELAGQLNDSDKAEQFLALIKEKVLSDDAKSESDINDIIDECSKDLDITVTDDQKAQIAELMQKINKLDLNVNDLKEGAKIVVPNDPSNRGRALILLEKQGLIKLKNVNDLLSTVADIVENPKNLKISEVDTSVAARALDDVDLAVVNNTYAGQVGLNAQDNGVFVEDKDSPYVNIIVARTDNKDSKAIQDFVKAYQTEEVYQEAKKHFKDGVVKGW